MSAKPKVDEQSFGVIPIQKKNDEILFLLIQHRGGHWAFPKGHANVGETEIETARRELREETGIKDVDLRTDKVFEERYQKTKWREPKKKVIKSVRYYIGDVKTARIRLQAAEVRDHKWVTYAEARKLITFEASRTILEEAAKALGIKG